MTDMMLVPAHWYSWEFDVTDGQRRIARVEMSAWRENGVLNVDGINHLRIFAIWLALVLWKRDANSGS